MVYLTILVSRKEMKMAKRGKIIENPITGERMEFIQTSEDTEGGLLQLMLTVKPKGYIGVPHVHPYQEERLVVKSGSLLLKLGDDVCLLTAGHEGVIARGIPHLWWNSGSDDLKTLVEFRPALQIENYFSSILALAQAGKLNQKGLPNLLQIAVMNRKYWYEIYLTRPSIAVQKAFYRSIAWIGRLLGYQPDYPCASRTITLERDVYEYDLVPVPVENCD